MNSFYNKMYNFIKSLINSITKFLIKIYYYLKINKKILKLINCFSKK